MNIYKKWFFVFWAIALSASHAHATDSNTLFTRLPAALVQKDEWEFQQVRERIGGKVEVNPEIRFSVLKLRENWIGFGKAITDDQQIIWEPLWVLPQSRCVQDFLGRSDLGLLASCAVPLTFGLTWRNEEVDGDEVTKSNFKVEAVEEVSVKAGKFLTVRVVETADIFATEPGNSRQQLSARVRTKYWFSHDAKAFVRTIREYSSPKGKLDLRITEELKSFKVQQSYP